MQDHLSGDAIQRLVYRRCHASRAYGWLLHLLSCAECRRQVAQNHPGKGERFLREIFRTQEPLRPPDLDSRERLDRLLEHLQTHGLLEYVQDGDVPPLLAELDRHPPERQWLILDNTERLWTLTTVEHLFGRCERELHRDPLRGQYLAEQAMSILDRLSPDHYHPKLLQDVWARAWALRGNFRRIREQFSAAEEDLGRAEAALESGTGDIDERLRFLQYSGSMAADRRRFRRSVALREKLLQLSRSAGNRTTEFNAIIRLVNELPQVGRLHEAIDLGEEYIERFSPERDGSVTLLALLSNLSFTLGRAGRGFPAYRLYQQALRIMPADKPRIAAFLHWQALTIFESLGDLTAADEVAQAVTSQILEHLSFDDFGSLMADRARLAMKRGDRALARAFGRKAQWIFTECGQPKVAQVVRQMVEGGPLVRV